MAGSARSLADKLGVAPGLTVYVDGGPPHVGDLLDGATYRTRLPRRIDLTLLFVTDVARCRPRSTTRWCAAPASRPGVVDVKVAAIDATWSGLKLVRRLRDR